MARLTLQSPWVQYYEKLMVLFSYDSDIRVLYDEGNLEVKLYVSQPIKAKALEQLLPAEKTWGNVTLKVTIVPANDVSSYTNLKQPIVELFTNNPIVEDIVFISGIMTNDLTYIIFRKEVVQYYIDTLSDAHGNRSTLWEEIAREIFDNIQGVFFCTSEYDPVFESEPTWP